MSKLYFNGSTRAFLNDTSLTSIGASDVVPSVSSAGDREVRTKVIQFGNGYAQEAPDGLNPLKTNYQIAFKNRRKEVINAVDNFLSGIGSAYPRTPDEYFYWTPDNASSPLKFKCKKWNISWQGAEVGTLTGVFEQTFEI